MKAQTLNLLADALADRVVERLAALLENRPAGDLIDAAEVARRFNVDRTWVYDHADELGAIRLGNGDRPRLRFDAAVVVESLAARPSPVAKARPRPSRSRPNGELLPIRGPQ